MKRGDFVIYTANHVQELGRVTSVDGDKTWVQYSGVFGKGTGQLTPKDKLEVFNFEAFFGGYIKLIKQKKLTAAKDSIPVCKLLFSGKAYFNTLVHLESFNKTMKGISGEDMKLGSEQKDHFSVKFEEAPLEVIHKLLVTVLEAHPFTKGDITTEITSLSKVILGQDIITFS